MNLKDLETKASPCFALDQMTKEEQLEYLLWLLGHQPGEKAVQIAEEVYLELITLREAIEELESL